MICVDMVVGWMSSGTLRAGVLVWVPGLMVVEAAWVPNAGYLYGVVEQRGP